MQKANYTPQELEDFENFLKKKCGYPHVKMFPEEGTYGAILKLMFHYTILTGEIGDYVSCDRWCYTADLAPVVTAFAEWDGKSELKGWQRHPTTGRRRTNSDPNKEYIEW
jgi:hypothetical protein